MYKIGEFAKLCNSTSKLIRFYDDVGLLKADYIDNSSGYRYYTVEQVEIFKKIILFREVGFTLREITQELLFASDEKIAKVLEAKEEELRKKYELCRKLTEEYKEKINMSIQKVEFLKGIKNDSVVIKYNDEYLELFTDEQNIEPVIQAFDMAINVPGYISLDVNDILYFPNQYNKHSINYIHFRGKIDELNEKIKRESHPEVNYIFVSIKCPPSTHMEEISLLSNALLESYSEDLEIVWGSGFDESLSDFDVSIIEFY